MENNSDLEKVIHDGLDASWEDLGISVSEDLIARTMKAIEERRDGDNSLPEGMNEEKADADKKARIIKISGFVKYAAGIAAALLVGLVIGVGAARNGMFVRKSADSAMSYNMAAAPESNYNSTETSTETVSDMATEEGIPGEDNEDSAMDFYYGEGDMLEDSKLRSAMSIDTNGIAGDTVAEAAETGRTFYGYAYPDRNYYLIEDQELEGLITEYLKTVDKNLVSSVSGFANYTGSDEEKTLLKLSMWNHDEQSFMLSDYVICENKLYHTYGNAFSSSFTDYNTEEYSLADGAAVAEQILEIIRIY